MEFDHVHFYVQDAKLSRNWFVEKLKFEAAGHVTDSHTYTEVVKNGQIYFLLSSPISPQSEAAEYLRNHSPGVVDVAFQVNHLDTVMNRIRATGGKILQPTQYHHWGSKRLKWATILGWGGLRHTLIEQQKTIQGKAIPQIPFIIDDSPSSTALEGIDHVVFNVAAGELNTAITQYQKLFGLESQQSFNIQTERSGLRSQVLNHPEGSVQFPINEPTSATSQIQEFLEYNQGSGIQHIALKTNNIIQTVTQLIQQNLPFLSVPDSYYTNLKKRGINDYLKLNWDSLKKSQILVDWKESIPEAILLQIFTQPIFDQPTFFFEFIERKVAQIKNQLIQAQGFGEGNFQALFEAVEQDQINRMLNQIDDENQ
ncbi:MAG: 4-hydroxyphenylpyruvate dioxygenase [Microcoleaceae cyanobacterium]